MTNEWITPDKFYTDRDERTAEVLYWNWNHIWIKRDGGRVSRMKWGTFKKKMGLS